MDLIMSSKYCVNSSSQGLIGEENVFADDVCVETRLNNS